MGFPGFGTMLSAIVQFAKASRPGRVKTRLEPALSPDACASLQAALVGDVWERVTSSSADARFLYCDIDWAPYQQIAGAERFRLQREGDLGARMLGCFDELAAEGFDRIVIVGSDSPTLPVELVDRAIEALAECDAVLGPAEDGGYYLVGCRAPDKKMFGGVEWSSERTFAQTEAAFSKVGFSTFALPPWWDVDTPADLLRLRDEPDLGPATRAWLAQSVMD